MILSDTVANKELFTDMKNALFCRANNPRALANKILFAQANYPQATRIAKAGYHLIHHTYRKAERKLIKIIDAEY